jgi:glycosyltransferase involved in cell wall biosynthesis
VRLFQITESLEVGGAERVVVTLANALAAHHQVSVVCLKRVGTLAESLRADVQVHCIGKREGLDPASVIRLARLMRRERPDVMHTHDWGVYLDAMLASALARVPVNVHTVHGLYMEQGAGPLARLKRGLRHALERRLAGRGSIVCVSQDLRRHVAAEVGLNPSALHAIANGVVVDPEMDDPPVREQGGMRFIAVSRLAAVKNLSLMIRAFARADPVARGGELAVVGDGPERPALEALVASLGMSERVRFLGFRKDTDELIRAADVLLLSSISEGIPMAVLEAMKHGRAVIATDVGGVSSVVQDGKTGLLVPSGNEASFQAALEKVYADPALAHALGRAGHARARAEFGIDRMVDAYLNIYRGSR